jgi:hypothetical protein
MLDGVLLLGLGLTRLPLGRRGWTSSDRCHVRARDLAAGNDP